MRLLTAILLFFSLSVYPQNDTANRKNQLVNKLLDSLWVNPTSFFNKSDTNWRLLCENLQHVDMQKLNHITASIYSGPDAGIKNNSNSSNGILGKLNKRSQEKKLSAFYGKIEYDFNDKDKFPDNKIVLVEGDSWFEYPLFLEDITDNMMKEENLAVYSLASGGDWVANMVASGDYKIEYLNFRPDVFIISGGGNDLLQDKRLMTMVTNKPVPTDASFLKDYREYVVLRQNHKPVPMCTANFCPIDYHLYRDSIVEFQSVVDMDQVNKITNGRRYLTDNFYRWLVSFKLEYKILFESLRKIDSSHFNSLKIITQGYDNAIPSSSSKFGIRLFMKNGTWLKEPLELLGITDAYTQESIMMALIFDFNEMLIELGKEYPNIYHIDSRGFTAFLAQQDGHQPKDYWYDELHPVSRVFEEITKAYIAIIDNKTEEDKRVFSVIEFYKNNSKQTIQ